MSHVAIIFKPRGGSARNGKLQALIDALAARSITVESDATTPEPDSATMLARQAVARGAELVIAFGGDGTARQVAAAVRGTGAVMAVYPGGTGNLFAKSFFVPSSAEQFVQMLAVGEPQPVDLMEYECVDVMGTPHKGLVMVGLGIGSLSDAISAGDPYWKRMFGSLVYAWNMVRAAWRPAPIHATVSLGQKRFHHHFTAAFILNVPPPLMPAVSRGCNASDGLLDCVVRHATRFLQIASCSRLVAMGRPEQSRHYWRCRSGELTVDAQTPILLNLDGDVDPTTGSFTVRTLPQAVRMLLA